MTAALNCEAVSAAYAGTDVVSSVDLRVEEGEVMALLGPSGSGKTTLIYAIAGLLEPTTGTIEIKGRKVSGGGSWADPEHRGVGLVFQNYALWPHLTAAETVAYPMRRSGLGKRDSLRKARALLADLGVGDLAERKPSEMSGGQQQRVGLARALAREADLYLFDEPTAHLDATVRTAIQEEIRRHRQERGAAAIYSTHDSAEALAIADRVSILRSGSLIQVGDPIEVYERPVDLWAARLTGPASVLSVDLIARSGDEAAARIGDLQIPVGLAASPDAAAGGASMLVRPEWVRPGGDLNGRVIETWFRGPHTDYSIVTSAGTLQARLPGRPRLKVGESRGWSIERGWITPDVVAR